MQKTGYLIINLGTPDSPSVADVRRYLKEFLLDPYVVTLPWLLRNILVRGIILPYSPAKAAIAISMFQSGNGSQQGGFATTVRPQNAYKCTRLYLK